MKFACVVVIYNPDEKVYDNIKTYIDLVDKLYVVDNTVQPNFDLNVFDENKVVYNAFGENKGLATALNWGMDKAIIDGYKWIITMDQDSSFQNDIVAIFRKSIENMNTQNVAILCPQYDTDRLKIENRIDNQKVYWSMQSACAFNLDIFKKIGKFEEKYFIDCIDYEYCLRCHKFNYDVVRCNEAVLKHSPAQTKVKNLGIKKLKYGYASPARIYYQVRNALDMYKRFNSFKAFKIVIVKFLKIVLLFDKKKVYLRYFNRAIRDYRVNKYGVLEENE